MSLVGTHILVALAGRELATVTAGLRAIGCRVLPATDGHAALKLARQQQPDMALLDLNLPKLDGLSLCKELRREPETSHLPVFILSAENDPTERLLALELGADEFLPLSCSARELGVRVRNMLERIRPGTAMGLRHRRGKLEVDPEAHQVIVQGRAVSLTPMELKLLSTLIHHPGQVWSRARLLATIWTDADLDTERTVDTHIRRLRAKLGSARNSIRTVRGAGYAFKSA